MWFAIALKKAGFGADTNGHQADHGGVLLAGRPSRLVVVAELAALGGAVALAISRADTANWDLALLSTLLVVSVVCDGRAVESRGSF
jgi:hypothetical protein